MAILQARDEPEIELAVMDGPLPSCPFIRSVSIDMFDLAGCEADQLDMILLSFNKRTAELTPEERTWYERATSTLMTRVFRETYRQGVYEAVRGAWMFSKRPMP